MTTTNLASQSEWSRIHPAHEMYRRHANGACWTLRSPESAGTVAIQLSADSNAPGWFALSQWRLGLPPDTPGRNMVPAGLSSIDIGHAHATRHAAFVVGQLDAEPGRILADPDAQLRAAGFVLNEKFEANPFYQMRVRGGWFTVQISTVGSGVVDLDFERNTASHWHNLLRIEAFAPPQILASAPPDVRASAAFLDRVDTSIANSVRIACLLVDRLKSEGLPGSQKAKRLGHASAPS